MSLSAAERLQAAIAGERLDWHEVAVRPDDIAALLRAAREALAIMETVEALGPFRDETGDALDINELREALIGPASRSAVEPEGWLPAGSTVVRGAGDAPGASLPLPGGTSDRYSLASTDDSLPSASMPGSTSRE